MRVTQEKTESTEAKKADYEYAIEACDVLDKVRLRLLRERRKEWISWLRGDDPHSIWRQITGLLWDDVLFRTINDLRRHAAENPSAKVGFNGPVLRLFDVGFITTQVTTIRRLTDRQPKDPKKGVISLRRLVEDIRVHRDLLNREVYVAYDGLPYDSAHAHNAWLEKKVKAGTLGTVEWLETTGPNAWATSDMVHENSDKLTKASTPASRSRTDLISLEWFDWLDSRLDVCNDIRKFTDKFVAHAGG